MADPWAAFDGIPGAVQQAQPPSGGADAWGAFDGTPAPVQAAPPAATATPAQQQGDPYIRRLGLGMRDLAEGVVGVPYNAAAWALKQVGVPVNYLGENLTALGVPQAETPGEKLTSAIAQPIAGTLTGQGVGRAMMGATSPIVQGVGEALTLQPGTQVAAAGLGGMNENLTGSPAAGVLTSLGVGAARGLSAAIPPMMAMDPARAPLLATAAREGISVTPRQITGGRVASNLESVLADLPGASGVQARVNAAQQGEWNRAAMGRTGTPSDTALPADIAASRGNISQTYQDLTARNTLQTDPQFLTDVRNVAAGVNRYLAESDRSPLNARIEDVVNAIENGTIPGRSYQNLYSALGQDIRSSADGKERMYLGQLRDALRGAMDRSISPQDADAWARVRDQFASLETVGKAMNRPGEGTATGNVPMAGLAQASNNAPTKAYANAAGPMNDLARLGQILKQTVPSSGTSQRNFMTALLTGGALTSAGTAIATGGNPVAAAIPAAAALLGPWAIAQLYHSGALRNSLMSAAPMTLRQNALLNATIGGESSAGLLRDR